MPPTHCPLLRRLPLLSLCALLMLPAACKKAEEAAPAAPETAPDPAAPAATPAEPKAETEAPMVAKWPSGKRLQVHTETVSEIEFAMAATAVTSKTESHITQDIAFAALKERVGGGNEIEVQVTSMTMENRSAGKVVASFDPKSDPKKDPRYSIAASLRKLLGAKLKYLTTAEGKIDKVEGLVPLLTRLNTAASPQALILVRTLINDDAVKSWDTLHFGLPDQPVKPGSAWEVKRDIPFGPTKFTLTGTNTFTAWEQRNNKKVAHLVFQGTMTTKEGMGSGNVTLAEGSTVTGKSWYDPELGVIEETESLSQFTVNVMQTSGQTTTSKYQAKVTSKLAGSNDSGTGTPAVAETAPIPAAPPAAKAATPK